MNKKWKKIWLKALRSDAYVQGTDSLVPSESMEYRGDRPATDTFCCLGVLVNEMASKQGLGFEDVGDYDDEKFNYPVGEGVFKGEPIGKALGISNDESRRLMVMNDAEGKGFKAIAKWIEKNL